VIVAERYGSVGPDGLSYTEMEYRYAVEQGVPVAALLLDPKARATWPAGLTEFQHRDKVNAFRTLCQQRMIAHWSDAGSLASKCLLALAGLINRHPRTGWVPANFAASPQVLSELARLSQENAELRSELAKLSSVAPVDHALEAALAWLQEPLLADVGKLAAAFSGRYSEILKNTELTSALEARTLFEYILSSPWDLLDGTSARLRPFSWHSRQRLSSS
jgi:hypothetical protein